MCFRGIVFRSIQTRALPFIMSMSMSYFPCVEYLRKVQGRCDTSTDSVTEELKL